VLDFWQMSPETLGGAFDVVLNLGFLYHLPKPVEALELTKRMSRQRILLVYDPFEVGRTCGRSHGC
jgi:hypothetical protein